MFGVFFLFFFIFSEDLVFVFCFLVCCGGLRELRLCFVSFLGFCLFWYGAWVGWLWGGGVCFECLDVFIVALLAFIFISV